MGKPSGVGDVAVRSMIGEERVLAARTRDVGAGIPTGASDPN
jgi:hypothetical protein